MDADPCPSCGEQERQLGEQTDVGIRLTCEVCDASWMRSAPRCRTCGGQESVTRPQLLTGNPRGNQRAILCAVMVRLCRVCDADVLAASTDRRQAVPGDYVSHFMTAPRPARDVSAPALRPVRPPLTQAPNPPIAGRETYPATPTVLTSPTVRQAIENLLAAAPDTSAGAVLMLLGIQLRPATRLIELDRPGVADALPSWVTKTWSAPGAPRRDAAVGTISAAFSDWRRRGWLTTEPSDRLL